MAMFGYMTEIETVEATSVEEVTASGDLVCNLPF